MSKELKVLIVGTDFNAYYMSRCYHELTGKNADVMGKNVIPFTSISNPIVIENFSDKEIFKKSLIKYAKENKKYKLLLIATSDLYVKMIAEEKETLSKYYLFNYPDIEIVNSLLTKEIFYEKYKEMGIDIPKTYIYKCNQNDNIDNINDYFNEFPLIIKPSDVIEYHNLKVVLNKVYKVYDKEELKKVISEIEEAGYNDSLIVQEFIPGDDSSLFDSVFYVNKNHKAELATFAQIGLQERTPTGIGNCTVLVNGFDEHGYKEELVYKLKEFLEKINYQGFAEFDMKYDIRDNKYKVLEINPRQARSSYYLAALGHNLVKYLIDDLVNNEQKEFHILKEKIVLTFVPKIVIRKYIKNPNLKKEINRLIRKRKIVNPLKYKKDKGKKRRTYMFLRDYNYIKKYKKYKF